MMGPTYSLRSITLVNIARFQEIGLFSKADLGAQRG
jgi:hypothetical protein